MKKIIVCTPYFKDIGGTELEALNSAIFLKKENKEIEVYIFTPKKEVHPFFVQELSKYNIKLFTYPFFFYLKHFRRFKGLLESLFWVLKSMTNKYSFYILGYLPAVYFFPILLVKRSNKVLKLTMNHFDTIPEDHFKYYDKLTKIIVFNNKQKKYWESNYQLTTTIIALDITISKEQDLLSINDLKKPKEFVFGYLGRVSKEKNLEDMIELVHQLRLKYILVKLIIQGACSDDNYLKKISKLILDNKLTNQIEINNFFISPDKIDDFYSKIDVFLVTSTSEGGPLTALEALAAGRIVMSYNIGAMKERLGCFPLCINNNIDEMTNSVITLINMKDNDFADFAYKLRNHYVSKLSNHQKIKALSRFILME